MTQKTLQPDQFIEERHLEYLDDLRESGETNMFGATAYVLAEFPELSTSEARKVLSHWMTTFGQRGEKK